MEHGWKEIKISSAAIKKSMLKALHERLGPDATLGQLAEMSVEDLRAIPYAGGKAVDSCIEALRLAVRGQPLKPVQTVLDRALADSE